MANQEVPRINLAEEMVDVLHQLADRSPDTLSPTLRRAIAVEKQLREQTINPNNGFDDHLPPIA